ncbi:MAG: hypothetical protein EA425_18485 [Puniceicoccaceae bacterium]|nr:MAG: hypothetical protein EA425_18485 [Puniceicoccaceae bacterium]
MNPLRISSLVSCFHPKATTSPTSASPLSANFTVLAVALLMVAMMPGAAWSQMVTAVWTNANPDNHHWSQEGETSNWSTAVYPSEGRGGVDHWHVVIGAPAPALLNVSATTTIDLLEVTPLGELDLHGGRRLRIKSGMVNDGLVFVNRDGSAHTTVLTIAEDIGLSGGGRLLLARHSDARLSVDTGKTLLHHDGHTVAGVGKITGNVQNAGVVQADPDAGVGTELWLENGDWSNTGRIEALPGSLLVISSASIENTSGLIRASAGTISLAGRWGETRIRGGRLESDSAGFLEATGWHSVLESVHLDGNLRLPSGNTLTLDSEIRNDGLIAINPTAGALATPLLVKADFELTGNGQLRLHRSAHARLEIEEGATLHQAHGHTITGVGRLTGNVGNQGLVRADGALGSGGRLVLRQGQWTNQGRLEAMPWSTLEVNTLELDNRGGVLGAIGGTIELAGATTVRGGVFEADADGVVEVAGNQVMLEGVRLEAPLLIPSGASLNLRGTMENRHLIAINPNAGAHVTTLAIDSAVELTGEGQVRLGREGHARIAISSENELIQRAGHTIAGTGRITGDFLNQSFVKADASLGSGIVLALLHGRWLNEAVLESRTESRLDLDGLDLFNSPTGVIQTAGGDVRLVGQTQVVGGRLGTLGEGAFEIAGQAVTLKDLRLEAPLKLPGGTSLNLEGSLVNDGIIAVNPTAMAHVTRLQAKTDVHLHGSGWIRLARAGIHTQLTVEPGMTLTHHDGHSIVGTGRLIGNVLNHGLVRADASLGSGPSLGLHSGHWTNRGRLEAQPGSRLEMDGITLDNTEGVILADGGEVLLAGPTHLTGGRLEAARGGFFSVEGNLASVEAICLQAPLEIPRGALLQAAGILENHATLAINPTAGASVTQLHFIADGELTGTGSLLLGRFSHARLVIAEDKVLLQQSGHSISGVGRIIGVLKNQGRIEANASLGSGTVLELGDLTNEGLLKIHPGTVARVPPGVLLVNAPNGRIGGGGTLELQGDWHQNGILTPGPGDYFRTLTIAGSADHSATSTLEIDIGGPEETDRLVVTDTFSAAGGLRVRMLTGAEHLASDDTITIVQAGSVQGTFERIEILPAGEAEIIYGEQEIRLTQFRNIASAQPEQTYHDWIAAQQVPAGQDGPGDDPGQTGYTNLECYYFGLPAMPSDEAQTGPVLQWQRIAGQAELHFSSPRHVTGVRLGCLLSEDLEAWQAGEPPEWLHTSKSRRFYRMHLPGEPDRLFACLKLELE